MTEFEDVVYYPPRDLDPGGSRQIDIDALVWNNTIQGLDDLNAHITFHVNVSRSSTGPSYFTVAITYDV